MYYLPSLESQHRRQFAEGRTAMDIAQLVKDAEADGVQFAFIKHGNLKIITSPDNRHHQGKLDLFKEEIEAYLKGEAIDNSFEANGIQRNEHHHNGSKKPAFNHTDYGNAERLVSEYGGGIRFCFQWKKWLIWDSTHWEVDETNEIERLAKIVTRNIHREVADINLSEEQAKAITRHAHQSEKRERIKATISLAESEPTIPVVPDKLDADPWLLNCKNGTVDLRTGELKKHNRQDLITRVVPYDYSPEGKEPARWLSFLERIFNNDTELISFVQRLLGYSLAGVVREHILAIFYGKGDNGKSVLLETLREILGEYGMVATASLLLAMKHKGHPTDIADLFRKRFVYAIETDDGRHIAEATVKQLTGGDSIRTRRLYENSWQFTPSHTLFLATNHKPDVTGTDHGIWRRLRLVPFDVRIPKAEQDAELKDKLLLEAPGIVRWLVQGCVEWQRLGLSEPGAVTKATGDYRQEQDTLGRFFEEHCLIGSAYRVKFSALYECYKNWAETSGERCESQKNLGAQLVERDFEKKKSNGIWYLGIGLREI